MLKAEGFSTKVAKRGQDKLPSQRRSLKSADLTSKTYKNGHWFTVSDTGIVSIHTLKTAAVIGAIDRHTGRWKVESKNLELTQRVIDNAIAFLRSPRVHAWIHGEYMGRNVAYDGPAFTAKLKRDIPDPVDMPKTSGQAYAAKRRAKRAAAAK